MPGLAGEMARGRFVTAEKELERALRRKEIAMWGKAMDDNDATATRDRSLLSTGTNSSLLSTGTIVDGWGWAKVA